jgi:hypothetical protein
MSEERTPILHDPREFDSEMREAYARWMRKMTLFMASMLVPISMICYAALRQGSF